MNKNPHEGKTWDEFEKEFFTPEEIEEANNRIQLPLALISIKEKLGLNRKELYEKLDVSKSELYKIEQGDVLPRFNTVCKMLKPFGLSLAIVNESNKVIHVFENK